MAQTRAKPRKPRPKPKRTAAIVAPLASEEILTLAEAAAFLRFTEAEILMLIDEQSLPGRPVGTGWRFLKSAIKDWLSTPYAFGKPPENSGGRRRAKNLSGEAHDFQMVPGLKLEN